MTKQEIESLIFARTSELMDRIAELEDFLEDRPDERFEVVPFDETPPHPFQITKRGDLTARVATGKCIGFTQTQLNLYSPVFDGSDEVTDLGFLQLGDAISITPAATNYVYLEVDMILLSQRASAIVGASATYDFYISAQQAIAFAVYTSAQAQFDGYDVQDPLTDGEGIVRYLIGTVTASSGAITGITQSLLTDVYNNYAGIPYVFQRP